MTPRTTSHTTCRSASRATSRRLAAVTVAAALAVAACGSDDASDDAASSTDASADIEPTSTDAPAATTPATTAEPTTDTSPPVDTSADEGTADEAAWPVTVEHIFGETTVDAEPQAIASLDVQWTDVLTALGAPVVAAADDNYSGSFYPWQELDGVEMLTAAAGQIPYEAVAAAQPDLITASFVARDQGMYDQLAGIAPTIPLLGGDAVDPWESIAAAAGELLGKQDEAAQLVADSDQMLADLAAELPGLEGKTYAMANYIPGDSIWVIADPDDGAAQLFAKLGMSIDPEILEMPGVETGRVNISLENIGELDADLLIIFANGADTAEIAGFDALPAVQSGAVADLGYHEVVGLNTPTPLSIPYSLDFIRPALEAAAAT